MKKPTGRTSAARAAKLATEAHNTLARGAKYLGDGLKMAAKLHERPSVFFDLYDFEAQGFVRMELLFRPSARPYVDMNVASWVIKFAGVMDARGSKARRSLIVPVRR